MTLAAAGAAHDMLMTMVVAIAIGALLIVLARRLNIPGIVLLLGGGVLLGPAVLHVIDPANLGNGLRVIVSLAVGLILFEGGLTLDVGGYRSAPAMIKRLLSAGVLVTWAGAAAAIMLFFDLPLPSALMAGSLVIVTGPTVIAPLLKRIKVNAKLHSILHWEGVLIDPIGVFIALLCFEWLSQADGAVALTNLAVRVVVGLGIGAAGGFLLTFLVRREIVTEDLVNVFALGFAVLVFGLADAIRTEAGILAVTVAGFVFGLTGGWRLKTVRRFKAEITDLLIGTLFILLAARLSFEQFRDFGLRGAAVVGVVMLVLRPVAIVLCSWGLDLSGRERAFLSWVAPRGIVAASMASLFAITFEQTGGIEDPKFVETFTYSVIVATIVIQGLTAGPLARLLDVRRPDPTGWLVVGAHAFGRRFAQFVEQTAGRTAVLVDTNGRAVRDARRDGLEAILADGRDAALADRPELQGVGYVLALTDNEDLNVRVCEAWRETVGRDRIFRCDPGAIDVRAGEENAGETAGHAVWTQLPKPSLLSAEIQRGEAVILEAAGHEPAFAELAVPLAVFDGQRVRFDAPPPQEEDEATELRTLYLQRQADYLMRALRPELIVEVDAADLRSLFEQLVGRMARLQTRLRHSETIEELLERETAFPTVLGKGVALPHAFSGDIDRRLCAMARVPNGVPFGAEEDEPIRLVFLLVSPAGDPEGHLATLAEIARLVHDDAVRESLMGAGSALDAIRIIRAARR